MRRIAVAAMVLAVATGGIPPAGAELLSKRYEFKAGVILEIGQTTAEGLRLDSVRFQTPTKVTGRIARVGGLFSAEVSLSNTSERPRKAGVALALYDDQGRLLGVASGGSRVKSIKPGRQKRFTLVFDDVNAEAFLATQFQVSLETKGS